MSLKCHRYAICSQFVHVHISDNYVSTYTSYQLKTFNNVTKSTGIHAFHIRDICPTKYAYHIAHVCPTVYKLQITAYISKTSKTVYSKLSSNKDMYHAFCKHINSLSSMTTYVLLVWQTYFVFCIYANNFGNCTHKCKRPMKC